MKAKSPKARRTLRKPNDNLFTFATPDVADYRLGRAHQASVLSALPLNPNRAALAALRAAPPRAISHVSTRTRLLGLQRRALAGGLNASNQEFATEFFEGALNALDTEETVNELVEMVAAARAGDLASRVALGRRIASNVGNLIRSSGAWIQWYEYISLAEDEVAWLRNWVPQNVDVRVGNADGTMTTRHAIPNQEDNTPVNLYFLLSDMFVTKLFDENKGDVSAAALGTIDISLDISEKLDGLLQLPFLIGTPNSVYVSNFVNDGTPASHFHVSSRIKAANFPTGNIIALASNGANTVPRFDIIRAIDEYFGRFGASFDPAGEMYGAEIRVASGIAHQFGNEFTPTSTANPVTDGLFRNRGQVEYNGKIYPIVPDATIDPTDKHVYVRSNLLPGLHFEKPAGALVHREEKVIENEVETMERILVGQAIPVDRVPRVLAVKFKN